jgi:hypothetical protein
MPKVVCPKHGSYHIWGCVHVARAVVSDAATPALGEPNRTYLVCGNCLTPAVREQLLGLKSENYYPFLDQLVQDIGFYPLCAECLYEKTGIDRRKSTRREE